MKALLLHPDHDFDLQAELPTQWQSVAQDLELETVLIAMAQGDTFLLDVARKALLAACGPGDAAVVHHRQAVMLDVLRNAQQVRALYALVVEAIESRKKHYFSLGLFGHYPGSLLHGAVDLMATFTDMLPNCALWATPSPQALNRLRCAHCSRACSTTSTTTILQPFTTIWKR